MRFRKLWQEVAFDILLVVIASAFLMRPWFRTKYLDNWGSIESTFISDARFLVDHWPAPKWQPLWYGGTRFDYVYPPGIRYGPAAMVKLYPKLSIAKAYHIYTGFFFCVGIAAIYFLVRVGSGSRRSGFIAAAAAALVSPALPFLPEILKDAGRWISPTRLSALVRYGEGPHMTAFALIPVALAACWFALRRLDPLPAAVAAIACAGVVSNNFYGATALAMFLPLLMWSLWITHQDHRIFVRVVVIGLVGYGLTALWLTPSYLFVTVRNLQFVSAKGNAWSLWIFFTVLTAYLVLTDRWARGRRERAWPVFVFGAALFFFLNVVGNYTFNFRVIGEPMRMVPELDLTLILLVLLGVERLWRTRAWIAGWLLVALLLAPGAWFFYGSRRWFPMESDPKQRIEYRLTSWIRDNLPGQRLLVSGSLRFWYNGWHDLPHVGGGSEQGLLNTTIMPAQWEILLGQEVELTRLWLQVTGADAVVVHGPKSQEWYKDFVYPDKFKDASFRLIRADGEDNFIYGVPRKHTEIARVVDVARSRALPVVKKADDREQLRAHVAVLEDPALAEARIQWFGTDAFEVRGRLESGQGFSMLESFDPAWRATVNGRPVAIEMDGLGFMRVAPGGSGETSVRFEFVTPLENQVGLGLTALSLALLAWYLLRRKPLL